MQFNIKSTKERREIRAKHITKWHKKFAWRPTRISDTQVVWLSDYGRKATLERIGTDWLYNDVPRYSWEYVPIEEATIKRLIEAE